MSRAKNYRNFSDRSAVEFRKAPVSDKAWRRNHIEELRAGNAIDWRAKSDSTLERVIYRVASVNFGPLTPRIPGRRPVVCCEAVLADAIARWLFARVASRQSLKLYVRVMRHWLRTSGLRRLDWQCAVTAAFLFDYRQHLAQTLAPRTVNTAITVLRSWFTWLHDHGFARRSPFVAREHLLPVDRARLYHANRVGHCRRSLTDSQAQALAGWCYADGFPPARRLALLLMACTGLRPGEVIAAQFDWFFTDGADRCVTVRGKGQRSRTLILEPIVVRAFDELDAWHPEPGRPRRKGHVIVNANGLPYSHGTIANWVRGFGETVGRPDLTPHELRRTYATRIRDNGAPLEAAQKQLGHSSPALTQEYYDVGDRRLRITTGLEAPTTTRTTA
ncbi:MAG: tyrosine-type recombinase/integrase [Planctomycetes bacterium]|nr:tyrosine-type recombinase/integrase [Planctomycetota bacterium]